jgi:hypothetical protein
LFWTSSGPRRLCRVRVGSESSGVEELEDHVVIDGRVAGGDRYLGFVDELGGAAGRDQLEAGFDVTPPWFN